MTMYRHSKLELDSYLFVFNYLLICFNLVIKVKELISLQTLFAILVSKFFWSVLKFRKLNLSICLRYKTQICCLVSHPLSEDKLNIIEQNFRMQIDWLSKRFPRFIIKRYRNPKRYSMCPRGHVGYMFRCWFLYRNYLSFDNKLKTGFETHSIWIRKFCFSVFILYTRTHRACFSCISSTLLISCDLDRNYFQNLLRTSTSHTLATLYYKPHSSIIHYNIRNRDLVFF